MAGLGLMNAVKAYQDGVAWRQQQDDVERQQKQRATYDAANQAAADVLESSKAEWALNGAQGQYQPSDTTMLKSAEARGQALAKGGDWESYLKNEAAVQGQRTRLRANALQRFEQDGDPVALAQAVYPTVFDGREIVSVEKVGGMPALASIGRPATESAIRYKLSDGTEGEMPVAKMVGQVKSLLVDPVAAAQKEIELNFLRTKASIEAEKQKDVEREKGSQARLTEDLRGKNARGLADVKFGYDSQLADKNNASRERVGAGNNKATVTAAQISADGRVDAAGLRTVGGSKGSGSTGLLKTDTDSNGNTRLYFRDGRTELAKDADGNPIKSGAWGQRVDALAKTLRDAPGNFSKTPAELRRQAEETLSSGGGAAKPALSSFDPPKVPGLGDATPKNLPPLNSFMK